MRFPLFPAMIGMLSLFAGLAGCASSGSDFLEEDFEERPFADGDALESPEREADEETEGVSWNTPADDPAAYPVEAGVTTLALSDPRWVVPGDGLPDSLDYDIANDNVDIVFFRDRLFMAWRSAKWHFASDKTRLIVVSSLDQGITWERETEIAVGTDVREPRFLAFNDRLHLYFFEAGTNYIAFEPKGMWRVERSGQEDWTDPILVEDSAEVPWDLKVRQGKAYMTSYKGNHYSTDPESAIELYFKESDDGVTWTKVEGAQHVYLGGVSEAAFEFDEEGNLWAVTRNEDGDSTGFGSHVCFAPKEALSRWECSEVSDPERYDSPELFRHGTEIFLVGRRDIGGPYDEGREDLTFAEKRSEYLKNYSFRPKGTSLYRINRETRKVERVTDLPGCGDTSFPSVRRVGPHRFLLANYTSPLDDPDITWMQGQTSKEGTQIYLLDIEFTGE